MPDSREITKAIAAHGLWKARLAAAIRDGRAELSPERIEPDNLCDFGRWLHALPAADRSSGHFEKVLAIHASFHQEACRVLKLALSGEKDEAGKSMGAGGAYASISADLTNAMVAWKKALG